MEGSACLINKEKVFIYIGVEEIDDCLVLRDRPWTSSALSLSLSFSFFASFHRPR